MKFVKLSIMKKETQRIFYIDNLRIFLTMLVVAHHWAIANGAPGDWYYTENGLGSIGNLLFSLFVATNQAFFMGFFFFISGYFVPSSFNRKGGITFLKERFIRLGIPLLFYAFVISPLLIFSVRKFTQGYTNNLLEFIEIDGGFSTGPMWFVALLLIFSLVYWWFVKIFRNFFSQKLLPPILKRYKIIGMATLIVITFLIRIKFPVGSWVPVLGIQPAHLTQYILCFALGIWAYQNKSLDKLTFKTSKRWFVFAQIMIFIGFPAVFLSGGTEINVDLFMGGKNWQSFVFVLWEQIVALSLILGLLGIFKKYFSKQSEWIEDISKNSYAIYVFHGVVLVSLSLAFHSFQGYSFQKFLLLLIPALLFCYLLAKFVRSIPQIKRLL